MPVRPILQTRRRLDYIRFFRPATVLRVGLARDGAEGCALHSTRGRKTRSQRLRRGLPSQEPFPRHSIGIAPLTTISTFPLARFAFRPSTLGRERRGAREDAAMRRRIFVKAPYHLFAWLDMRTGFPMKASQICSP